MSTKIAIAGISSKLAGLIAHELLRNQDVTVRGSCHDITKLPSSLRDSPQVTLIQTGPYDEPNLRSLVQGCDVVICCYWADNETMVKAQKLLIDLSAEAKVNRYIASDYTIDYTKLEYGDIVEKDPMKEIKAYLDAKQDIKGVHILNGIFMETFLDLTGVWNPETRTLRYWGTGSEKWELTTYQTCAQYVAAVALDPTAVGITKFLGDKKSIFEIADGFEAICKFKPTLENRGSVQDCYQSRYSKEGFDAAVASFFYCILVGKVSLGEDLNNLRYQNVKPETIRQLLEHRLATAGPLG
ncbi:NAD(P)-binding protein [Cadophora sp. DSE1049]|nr:NAD(P)-binding protein [Cadophora sp. DSE1049]